LRHQDHPRPVTRRDFLRQGMLTGGTMITGNALLNLFLSPEARAAFDLPTPDAANLGNCFNTSTGSMPFICFDLAGGANIANSNVLVGKQGGQLDLLDPAGYRVHGLPPSLIPSSATMYNTQLGLKFHAQSAMLLGILSKFASPTGVDGVVIPAVSNNDTGNNPHNPLYAIAQAGTSGSVATLIGSVNSESGGNSIEPTSAPFVVDPAIRPVKVDRPTDVTGLVGTGSTGGVSGVLSLNDAVQVMQTAAGITKSKLGKVGTQLATETIVKQGVNCGYVKAAYLADKFGDVNAVDPSLDTNIKGPTGIFSDAEFNGDAEFRKTASVMKMVVNASKPSAGAGCITMGGFDYHTGDRTTGDQRDLRAGKCIGACLEYARRVGSPLMIYVFSDGSVFSDGTLDMNGVTDNGTGSAIVVPGGKGVWTGDSSTNACSFILVYSPTTNGVTLTSTTSTSRQLGWFRPTGAVETNGTTPGANNVSQLVEMVALNYLALQPLPTGYASLGALFNAKFPNNHLGSSLDSLVAFNRLT
jgi:hypothetical protein